MKQLRVVIDLRLAAYRTGGIARYATELFNALQRRSEISIRAVRSRADTTPDTRALRFRTPPHHSQELRAIGVELALARHWPDVYHATDFIAPRLPRLATVATVHDLEFLRHPEYLDADARRYYGQLEQATQWTDAWITPSQWTANDLSKMLGVDSSTITVIPHGIPMHLSRQRIVPRSERAPFILAVGTIEPRKRYDLLLDALGSLADAPQLLVVGKPGWSSSDTERRLTNTSGVIWRQDVEDTELRELYRTAFAVVVPSLSEGFGFAALEAMAAGTPVISSNHGALPEVTGLAALVPEADDESGWARAIERLLDDEQLWNELSLFGQRRARDFSWARSAAETIAVYQAAARA